MLAFLANLGIGTIVSRLAAAYEAKQRAQTDAERIKADTQIAMLEARRDVLVAEGRLWWINPVVRAGFALPVAVYLGVLIVGDKLVCKWLYGTACKTDDLSDNLWIYVFIVVGFYFVHDTVNVFRRK